MAITNAFRKLPLVAPIFAGALIVACGGSSDSGGAPTTPPTSAPLIASFTATPSSITAGGSSTLAWSVSNATTLWINQGVGAVTGSGTSITPATTTTYTLTATNPGGSTTATATVTVNAVSAPVISSFTATPSTIIAGGSSTLAWDVVGATTLSINQGVGVVTGTSASASPATTTTYTLTASNLGGSATATATVTVNAVSAPVISSFAAAPSMITAGGSSTLAWTVVGDATLSINQGVGAVTGTSTTVSPKTTTTYTLAASNSGGGTTASATVTVNAIPPPTVTISVPSRYARVGASVTLAWSSQNASACVASGDWAGDLTPSGFQAISKLKAGIYRFNIQCSGSQGQVAASTMLVVNDVLPSSCENKNGRGIAPVSMPTGIYGNTFALADFFATGKDALVVHTLLYDPSKPSTYGDYGKIYFFEKNASGFWIDKTAAILPNNVGCLHPRKAVVADFNNDGRPDVFFACHGADAPPYSGEHPHVLLSQPDGTYSNVTLPVTCYCHGASAADVNDDGYPDVLVVDPSVAGQPYFLLNNGDGTFASDKSRLPPLVVGKQIYTAELIDFSGSAQYDVFLAGNEPGTTAYHSSEQGPVVLPNDGTGHFISTAPLDLMVGAGYGLALDIVFTGPNIYLLKVNPGYTANQIQRVVYSGLTGNTIFTSSGAYPNGWTWVDWIIPYQGKIMSENDGFGLAVTQ